MYELIFSLIAGLSIFLTVAGAAQLRQGADMSVRLLQSLGEDPTPLRIREVEKQRTFARRVILPIIRQIARGLTWIWPQNRLKAVELRLLLAGSPGQMRPLDFIGLRVLTASAFIVAGAGYTMLLGVELNLTGWAMLGALVFCGFLLPDVWLSRRITTRQRQIQNALPDAIDMLTITTEAGLSFESGLQEIMTRWENELSREFARTLRDIGMGQSRRYALSSMATRTGVPDMQSFVTALNQAEELGVSIGRVLRTQSEDMRVRRRQRAYEKANQAPVKIMFPLVFLIFPSIFAVLLGPAVPQLLALGS